MPESLHSMTLRKEVSDVGFIHSLYLEHLDGDHSFPPFSFIDDAVTSLTDLLLQLNLTEIDIQASLKDSMFDGSLGWHLQRRDIKFRWLLLDVWGASLLLLHESLISLSFLVHLLPETLSINLLLGVDEYLTFHLVGLLNQLNIELLECLLLLFRFLQLLLQPLNILLQLLILLEVLYKYIVIINTWVDLRRLTSSCMNSWNSSGKVYSSNGWGANKID